MIVIYLMVCSLFIFIGDWSVCLFIQDRLEIKKLVCPRGMIGNEKLH